MTAGGLGNQVGAVEGAVAADALDMAFQRRHVAFDVVGTGMPALDRVLVRLIGAQGDAVDLARPRTLAGGTVGEGPGAEIAEHDEKKDGNG